MINIAAESLGSSEFKRDYHLRYAYLAGAMYKGIASKEMVIAMGEAGLLGYLGTGGMDLAEIDDAIRFIKSRLPNGQPYGMNLLCNLQQQEQEDQTVALFLKHGVRNI